VARSRAISASSAAERKRFRGTDRPAGRRFQLDGNSTIYFPRSFCVFDANGPARKKGGRNILAKQHALAPVRFAPFRRTAPSLSRDRKNSFPSPADSRRIKLLPSDFRIESDARRRRRRRRQCATRVRTRRDVHHSSLSAARLSIVATNAGEA